MFTIAIDDVLEFPVKFTLKNKGIAKTFAFSVTANRIEQSEINAFIAEKDKNILDFMRQQITGWSNQKLVLTEDGSPAEFSADALDALLDVAGVGNVIFSTYFKECGAKEKN